VQYIRKRTRALLNGPLHGPLDGRRKGLAELRMRRTCGCTGENTSHCSRKLLRLVEQVRNS
ncbi:hypothetical protein, partial [Mesorhizobium sp.]|uniref:hypothetical protein n=1 Tax=Mesorhizobium sp. TaxID=1871066 RepID=UPI0026008AAD